MKHAQVQKYWICLHGEFFISINPHKTNMTVRDLFLHFTIQHHLLYLTALEPIIIEVSILHGVLILYTVCA